MTDIPTEAQETTERQPGERRWEGGAYSVEVAAANLPGGAGSAGPAGNAGSRRSYQLGTVATVPRARKNVHILNSFEIRRKKKYNNHVVTINPAWIIFVFICRNKIPLIFFFF